MQNFIHHKLLIRIGTNKNRNQKRGTRRWKTALFVIPKQGLKDIYVSRQLSINTADSPSCVQKSKIDRFPHLPDTDASVGDENEQNHKGFHKSCDRVVVFKEGEHLEKKLL
jgi:hypothetical protein